MTTLHIAGEGQALLWGLTGRERLTRIARAQGLTPGDDPAQATLLANAAFAFDPLWLKHLAGLPGATLTMGGVPVAAHVASPDAARTIADAMAAGRPAAHATGAVIAVEDGAELLNASLRKRERPFVDRLVPDRIPALRKASYAASYKGVTDLLTKYLWPGLAFRLTRLAAAIGISPNQVTAIGAALCLLATWLFWQGDYWPGIAAGFGFMVLDTVDGKLARCTITASEWGNIFDHGIDLVHPPFWWWAWGVGLAAYGRPLGHDALVWTLAVIVLGYVVQRLIEGAFMRLYGGIHIHVWERIDSHFRLVTARRNPNMVILIAALLFGRPDIGLVAVAWWTVLSCLFHLVRLAQAMTRRGPIMSWLG